MASYHQIPMDPLPNRNRLIEPEDPFSTRSVTFAELPPAYTPIDAPAIQRTATPHDIAFNPYATSSGPSTVPIPTPDPTSYEPVRTAAQKQEDAEAALPPRPIPVSKKRACWNFWWLVLCGVLIVGAIVVGIKWQSIKALFDRIFPGHDGGGGPQNSTGMGNSSMALTTMLMPASTLTPTTLHTTTSAAATTATKFNVYMVM